MSSIPDPRCHALRRLSTLPTCRFCGSPIPVSDRRPREFCGAKCRQAAHRAGLRDKAETAAPNVQGEYRDSLPSVDPGTVAAPITHFLGIGARWADGVAVDRELIQKILSAELGDPGEPVTSSDGIAVTVRRRRSSITTIMNNTRNTPRPRPIAAHGRGGAFNTAPVK